MAGDLSFGNRLMDSLADCGRGPVYINQMNHAFTLDLAGEVGFPRSYGQIESGLLDPVVTKVKKDMQWTVYATSMPWLADTLMRIPGLQNPIGDLKSQLRRTLENVMATGDGSPNVLSWLLQDEGLRSDADTWLDEIRLLQIDASDTSYSTTVFILYYLANLVNLQEQQLEEVGTSLVPANENPLWSQLQGLPLLDSIIRKTLRLHQPARLGLPHELPRYGSGKVDSHDVPGEMMISVPSHSLHVNERYFEKPEEWIPERWTSKPAMVKDKRAWVPLESGPTACAGRLFAMMEIKLLIGMIVWAFEIKWPKGQDGEKLVIEIKDYSITMVAVCRHVLHPKTGLGVPRLVGIRDKVDEGEHSQETSWEALCVSQANGFLFTLFCFTSS